MQYAILQYNSHITKLIKTTGKVTDNSPLFRIFASTITIPYDLRSVCYGT